MSQQATSPGIPHIIHQIWYQGVEAVPDHYRAYAEGWKKHHPHWAYHLWDEASCRALLAERYADFLGLWEGYPFDIQRMDAIRYFILHACGGIYLDMDMECLKPLDACMADCDLLFSQTVQFNNAVIGSIAGHPFWEIVFQGLVEQRHRPRPHALKRLLLGAEARYAAETAGPLLLTRWVRASGIETSPGTRLCPGYVFEPGAPTLVDGRFVIDLDTTRSHAIHHEAMGWLSSGHYVISCMTRRLFRLLLARGKRRTAL